MIAEDGRPRAASRPLAYEIETLPEGELALRQETAERALIRNGIPSNVHRGVSPIRGVLRGGGGPALSVAVDVVPRGAIQLPTSDPAEAG